jgi:hypothetical protein
MFRGDQLQDRIAQILEPFVVRQAALRVLIVIGAVGERLPQQRNVVEADPKRPLELL